MENLPLVVDPATPKNFKPAIWRQAKRKAVEGLFLVCELLVPTLKADCAATESLLNPYTKACRTLRRNLQIVFCARIGDLRILLEFFFNAGNHHTGTCKDIIVGKPFPGV